MEREFILDDFYTWEDAKLILTAKSITPPTPKTNYVSIDGKDGTLDLSEALTGHITYDDRNISASFLASEGTYKDRSFLLSDIIKRFHGKKIKIIEPDDLDHYFLGRVNITPGYQNLAYATFDLDAVCDPWRYSLNETYRVVKVSDSSETIIILNSGVKTLIPSLIVTGTITVTFGDKSSELTSGTFKVPDLILNPGSNEFTITGSGEITFRYREADI